MLSTTVEQTEPGKCLAPFMFGLMEIDFFVVNIVESDISKIPP